MTCTLILTRHAKSAWDTNVPSDHARPLNKRGRRSAPAIGAWLRDNGYLPGQVISSSSQRTRETWELMEMQAQTAFTERLYHGNADIMFQLLQQAQHPCVMMIGHNPGIAAFAHSIVRNPPDHSRFDDYPTGATLVARFDAGRWQDISWGSARVLDFAVPRELLGE